MSPSDLVAPCRGRLGSGQGSGCGVSVPTNPGKPERKAARTGWRRQPAARSRRAGRCPGTAAPEGDGGWAVQSRSTARRRGRRVAEAGSRRLPVAGPADPVAGPELDPLGVVETQIGRRVAGRPEQYLAQPGLAAGRVLLRNQAEPSGEVAAAPEALHRRRKSLKRHRRNRSDPRYRHQSRRLFVPTRAGTELLLQSDNLRIEAGDLLKQKTPQFANQLRQSRARILECRCQSTDMSRSLRSDDAELRQVTPQRVDRLCPLAHQKIASTEQHPAGLLPLTLHGHDAHGRSLRCLAYRLRVRRVVLVPFDEGLHIDRRDQFHLVAELLGLPTPIVSARARFHRHRTARLRREEVKQLAPAQLLPERNRPVCVRPMQLKAVLRQIDPDDGNLLHGCLLPKVVRPRNHIGTSRCRREGASTPSLPHVRDRLRIRRWGRGPRSRHRGSA